MSAERLNQTAAARRAGVSDRRIRALEAQGRISRGDDGLYLTADVDRLIASLDQHSRRANNTTTEPETPEPRQTPAPQTRSADNAAAISAAQEADQSNRVYLQARAQKAAYEAKRAKLRFEEEAGELVSAADVKSHSFEIATAVRRKLETLNARLAPFLIEAGKEGLKTEIREAIEELQKEVADI